ncbi:peptidase domain-containing ABC transporter [Hymenobacter ruricola]|uniref:ATP-binding cassette domain-containing protein n=1 Tax=Hymenobacter ruricola TaxID=2791023 RepID=A0ABS0I1Q8_9BACT|nr:ATP-binding cassette domain-containing protein [Hymenobacter ruricola]MBF9220864.1 ATP-binding cassette domain-containing protein [Hymenobacter ruricola]
MQRLFRLFAAERTDITYLYVYAALAGLISLSLPLGVQSVIGFVSSGAVSTSLVVLIGLIVLGTLLVGGLQIMQVTLVEYMQQRLMARMALDFAVRLPQVRAEALEGEYLPELMNRLLDVPPLQKGLATLLIEFSAAALQILFGLLLLSFYHPIFIAFGGLLVLGLYGLIVATGPKGLSTSIAESQYKYRVVAWLEDVARTVSSFRLPLRQGLALGRTDDLLNGYLGARAAHFRVLLTQSWGFVVFKTLITAALLSIGCWLLIEKQINIGQFVAAEIVIILTIGAVEKLVLKLDVVYDALTSLDKIGHVLDLEAVPPPRGTALLPALPAAGAGPGLAVEVRDLAYRYPKATHPTLDGVSLTLAPGHHLALAGADGAGKTTLLRLLAGLLDGYSGQIVYAGLPLNDLSPEALAAAVGDNLSHQHLFSGTVLENITLNQPHLSAADAAWAVELVGLRDHLYARPTGLQTPVGPGHALGAGVTQKLLLARAVVGRPRLLLLDHMLPAASLAERVRVLRRLLAPGLPWTVVLGTTQPELLALLPRVAVLDEGRLVAEGTLAEVSQTQEMRALLGA